MKKTNYLTDQIVYKNSPISELNNNSNYVKLEELPDIIANIVTAEFIKAANADFSYAQIQRLMAGDLEISGKLFANEGNIGGAEIVNGILTISNANISEMLKTSKLVVADNSSNIIFFADALTHVVKIAGWDVNSDEITSPSGNVALYSGNTKTKNSLVTPNTTSPARIMAGSNDPSTAKFVVLDDGSVYAEAAKISGLLEASRILTTPLGQSKSTVSLDEGYIKADSPYYKRVGAISSPEIFIILSTFMYYDEEYIYGIDFLNGISLTTNHEVDMTDARIYAQPKYWFEQTWQAYDQHDPH